MIGYHGFYKKVNGEVREMYFVRTTDLPASFLNEQLVGDGNKKRNLKKGMETVWDVKAQAFRTFNWETVVGEIKEINFEENTLFPLTTS